MAFGSDSKEAWWRDITPGLVEEIILLTNTWGYFYNSNVHKLLQIITNLFRLVLKAEVARIIRHQNDISFVNQRNENATVGNELPIINRAPYSFSSGPQRVPPMQQVNYEGKAISSFQEGFMPITYRQNTASANADFLSNPNLPKNMPINKTSTSVNNMKQQPTSMFSNAGLISVPSVVSFTPAYYQTERACQNVGNSVSMQKNSNISFKIDYF